MATTPTGPMPNFQGMRDQADAVYNSAVARVNEQRSQMYAQYGYNPDGTLDHMNQYGLRQQEVENSGLSMLGDLQNEAGRGIGTTGLAAQKQGLLRYMHGKNVAGLSQSFLQGNTSLNDSQLAAGQQRDASKLGIGDQEAQWNYYDTLMNPPVVNPLLPSQQDVDNIHQGMVQNPDGTWGYGAIGNTQTQPKRTYAPYGQPGFTGRGL